MSSSLSVFLLDPKVARGFVGSCDDELIEAVHANFRDEMASEDDWSASSIANGAPTAAEALHAVVYGGPFDEDRQHAFQYGYAYKRLCSLTGSFLDNSCFCPFRGDWLELVDEGLEALRINAVSVAEFGRYRGLPDPVPSYDLPRCGEWTHDRCLEALAQFEQAKRDGHAPALDPEAGCARRRRSPASGSWASSPKVCRQTGRGLWITVR
ncbi:MULTISPECIES: hypothetical protein [unclassified Streptomyces]|uniref:DUF7691 family protein n=1 Tax=unclassified Streptomyces TaxID=2593676 RepID=UPI002034C6AA|nr:MULTISPECIES: hypothetical protein [unclassified Streptomyces]